MTSVAASLLLFLALPVPVAATLQARARAQSHSRAAVEVVVAAYRENLSFIEPLLARVPEAKLRLKCSGPLLSDPRCERLDDLGDENSVYLKHIVENYDNLPDVTVFSVGSIMKSKWGHLLCRKLNYVLAKIDTPSKRANFSGFAVMAGTSPGRRMPFDANFDVSDYHSSHEKKNRELLKLCRPTVAPFGEWFRHFVSDDLENAGRTGVSFNDIFAVSRERIRSRPKTTYEGLLSELARCGAVRSTASHYMERTWKALLELDVDGASSSKEAGENECPTDVQLMTKEMEFPPKRGKKTAATSGGAAGSLGLVGLGASVSRARPRLRTRLPDAAWSPDFALDFVTPPDPNEM